MRLVITVFDLIITYRQVKMMAMNFASKNNLPLSGFIEQELRKEFFLSARLIKPCNEALEFIYNYFGIL